MAEHHHEEAQAPPGTVYQKGAGTAPVDLRALPRAEGQWQVRFVARRAQLALTTLAALLTVSTIKLYSHTSCPWDLQEFGGVATYVSHWALGLRDGGTGGCFPAGHASAGFAFIGGFFAFRHGLPKTAWRWFAGAMLAWCLAWRSKFAARIT